jgi:hypothetical protein
VTVDGTPIWSKLETGEFPDEGEMLAKVESLTRSRPSGKR